MKKKLLIALLTTFSINAQTVTDYVTGLGVPTGVAFDSSGNLYVADYYNYNVTKITPGLTKDTFASGFYAAPQQIAIDSNNNLWIAGSGIFNQIIKVTPTGAKTIYDASNSPYGIAIDVNGNIYYSETSSGNITKITTDGIITTFASGLTSPRGLTFDKSGNLIVVEDAGKIKKISSTGVVSTLTSGITSPSNVVVAPNGDLYISSGWSTILRFPAGGKDGDQTQYVKLSNYDEPAHITIYNGSLYISTDAQKIIKITDPLLNPLLGLESSQNSTENDFAIYPNPATDYLYIKNNKADLKTIQILDLTGRIVKDIKPSDIQDNKITLSNLASGNYILKINDIAKKIIIK